MFANPFLSSCRITAKSLMCGDDDVLASDFLGKHDG
jgi:hypothetical protein